MENRLSPVFLITVLMSVLMTLILGLVTFLRKKSGAKSIRREIVMFALFFSLVIALTGLIGLPLRYNIRYLTPFWIFILTEVLLTVIGILSMINIRKKFWKNDADRNFYEFWLLFSILILGAALIFCIYYFMVEKRYALPFAGSCLAFLFPYFFYRSYEFMIAIPVPIYKVWFHPDRFREINLSEVSLSKMILIEIELSKNANTSNVSNLKGRTPIEIKFADYFPSLLRNYNEMYPDDPVVYRDSSGKAYGWMFFIKPSFFRMARYIDPDLTIKENRISEKHVIVSKRVIKD